MFSSTAKLLLPAGQREKGQAAKPATFQGYLWLHSEQRAGPGQLFLEWAAAGAGRGGLGIGATPHWPALSPEPQVTEMERAFLTLVPNLWKTREQVKCQLLPPLQLRPKREPKKVKNRLFLLIKIGQMLGTLSAPSPARHKKLCSIWSFSEALSNIRTSQGSHASKISMESPSKAISAAAPSPLRAAKKTTKQVKKSACVRKGGSAASFH